MAAYEDHPARRRAKETPLSEQLPAEIETWCNRIPSEEQAVYPIDQSDGGEDDDPQEHADWAAKLTAMGRDPKMPWKSQSNLIEIDGERDFISDKGDEIWSVLESRGITNVILAGVHTNMCVLGRPFGLRQMVKNGKRVALLRDMTDTMYNPRMWPYVSHFTGTDRIISHVERHVCPTITSDQIIGGAPFRFQNDTRPHVAILMSEDEYETQLTLTAFANSELGKDFRVSCIYGRAEDGNDLVGLDAVNDADLLIVSVRRRALPKEQLEIVRSYFASGKPAIGIRTASHAFALRDGAPTAGHAVWPEFDAQAWGGHYVGHYANDLATTVQPIADAASHPILHDVPQQLFASGGSLYRPAPLAEGATLLATGSVEGHPAEPVAWTFTRADGGQSFYTSLGHEKDFENPAFVQMLTNAVYSMTGKPIPENARVGVLGNDIRICWIPTSIGGDLDKTLQASLDSAAVWFRCGLRYPRPLRQDATSLAIRIVPQSDCRVWINGFACPACETDPSLYEIPLKSLDDFDANLLVVRTDNGAVARKFVQGGASIIAQTPEPHTVIALDGFWEARIGDDPAWSSPALPAKFALATSVYFDVAAND